MRGCSQTGVTVPEGITWADAPDAFWDVVEQMAVITFVRVEGMECGLRWVAGWAVDGTQRNQPFEKAISPIIALSKGFSLHCAIISQLFQRTHFQYSFFNQLSNNAKNAPGPIRQRTANNICLISPSISHLVSMS